jgi:hypothetical protein
MVPLPTETTPLPVEITNHTDWWVPFKRWSDDN